MDEQIKPVAWRAKTPHGWVVGKTQHSSCDEPLYPQQAIDALRAEVDEQCRLHAIGMERELALITERDRLRAEVAEAREFRDKMANAIGNDQLRRFIEKHGEPVPLTIRMQAAEARAERLAELLDQAYGYVPAGTLADQIHCALLRFALTIADAALSNGEAAMSDHHVTDALLRDQEEGNGQ